MSKLLETEVRKFPSDLVIIEGKSLVVKVGVIRARYGNPINITATELVIVNPDDVNIRNYIRHGYIIPITVYKASLFNATRLSEESKKVLGIVETKKVEPEKKDEPSKKVDSKKSTSTSSNLEKLHLINGIGKETYDDILRQVSSKEDLITKLKEDKLSARNDIIDKLKKYYNIKAIQ